MYAFCESDLEVILDKKQNDPRSDISVCLNEIIGILGSRNQRLVSGHDGFMKKRMTDITVIDEEKLIGSPLSGELRR